MKTGAHRNLGYKKKDQNDCGIPIQCAEKNKNKKPSK